MQVSTLLLTYNEVNNLVRCLEALSWCDDIVAIDSGSTDGSQEILQRYGVRVLFRNFDNFASQRNFGLDHSNLKYNWVLHLDADEITPVEFQTALHELPENPEDVDGYYVPSRMMLAGRWLKHAHGYPIYQARLGHRDRFRFIQVGHGQREHPNARMATFSEPYVHYNYSHGLKRYLERHLRYAADEAELVVSKTPSLVERETSAYSKLAFRRALKKIFNKSPLFPSSTFAILSDPISQSRIPRWYARSCVCCPSSGL